MKVLFRLDAGDEIGLGHFFRSVALARGLTNRGHQVFFTCKETHFWNQKIQEGFEWSVYFLNSERSETKLIDDLKCQLLFVDGNIEYSFENASKIKSLVPIIMYQNLTNSRVFADVYILPSIHQDGKFISKFNSTTKVYQGLEYFTFNERLYKFPSVRLNKNIRKIGVTSGGSDPRNVLIKVYDLVKNIENLHDFEFIFFFGENYLHHDKLPQNNSLCQFVSFNYHEILKCDLVISAFGVSSYELMALGMPIITLGHQESTSQAAEVLSNYTQSFMHLGIIDDLEESKIEDAISLMNSFETRVSNSERSIKFLDLNGIDRVVDIIENNYYAE